MKHSTFFYLHTMQRDLSKVPRGVKLVILATSVHMIAWGAILPYFPIYLNSIVNSYALVGLVFGIFSLINILFSIPVGDLSDKVKKPLLIVVALLNYPLMGMLYAYSTTVLHLVAVRIWNGFAGLFVWIPTESYLRKNSPRTETAGVFGLYGSVKNLAMVIGAAISIPLVMLFGLNPLFLLLIPLPIIAAAILMPVEDYGKGFNSGIGDVLKKDGLYKKELKDFARIGFNGFSLMAFSFFILVVYNLLLVYMPLFAAELKLDLVGIALLFILMYSPYLLSFVFAEFADRYNKPKILAFGFLIGAVILVLMSFVQSASILFFALALAVSLVIALVGPIIGGMLTEITPKGKSGEITGMQFSVMAAGEFTGAFAMGIIAQYFGIRMPFIIVGAILLLLGFWAFSLRNRLK